LTKQLVNLLEQEKSTDQIREAHRVALDLKEGDERRICLGTNFLVVFRKTLPDPVSVDILRRCPDHDQRFQIYDWLELVGMIFDLDLPDDPPGPNILDLPNSSEVKFKPTPNALMR
jgi:hypothetical protein